LARHRDHNDVVGNLAPEGERVVGEQPVEYAPRLGSQETITEYGMPYSRRYDAAEELDRVRAVWARSASMPSRPRPGGFRAHSMRRV
jgi:hypothetical protein